MGLSPPLPMPAGGPHLLLNATSAVPVDTTLTIELGFASHGLASLQDVLQSLHDVVGLAVRVLLVLCFYNLSVHRGHALMLAVGHDCERYPSNQLSVGLHVKGTWSRSTQDSRRDVGQPVNGAWSRSVPRSVHPFL